MTRFSQTNAAGTLVLGAVKVIGLFSLLFIGGCIADTAEDTALPWSTGKSWEGMAPIAPSVMDRYD